MVLNSRWPSGVSCCFFQMLIPMRLKSLIRLVLWSKATCSSRRRTQCSSTRNQDRRPATTAHTRKGVSPLTHLDEVGSRHANLPHAGEVGLEHAVVRLHRLHAHHVARPLRLQPERLAVEPGLLLQQLVQGTVDRHLCR